MITRADVDAAAARIAGRVRVTPVIETEHGSFKLELLQHTGTFKARGAFNRVLSAQESGELDPQVGIVVASGGNAGLANAYVAAAVGVPATVFVPTTAPAVKVARLRAYGAQITQVGSEYAEAYEAAREHADQAGAVATRTGVHSVLVTDQDLIDARRRLWAEYRIVVEHGAAAAFAALNSGAYTPATDARVAVLLCGANTDPSDL